MRFYTVHKGDTLFHIAHKFNIPILSIYSLNKKISPNSVLLSGDIVQIPYNAPSSVPTIYVIQPNDTLYMIAIRYRINLDELLDANRNISSPWIVSPGMRIILPTIVPSATTSIYYTSPKDTPATVASLYSSSVSEILRLNPDANSNEVFAQGRQLFVPLPPLEYPMGCLLFQRSNNTYYFSNSSSTKTTELDIVTPSGKGANFVSASPNGKYIAFSQGKYTGGFEEDAPKYQGNLYLATSCGKLITTLAQNLSFHNSLAWSNDSTKIAYSSKEGLFITDLTGNKVNILDNKFGPFAEMAWFPSDKKLALSKIQYYYFNEYETPYGSLSSVNIDGKDYIDYTVPSSNLKISPNGRFILSSSTSNDFHTQITNSYIFEPFTQKLTQITGTQLAFPEVEITISGGFSPDSTKVVYSSGLTLDNSICEIRIANTKGNILQSFGNRNITMIDWSPFPDWIHFKSFDLFLMNIRTGQKINVTKLSSAENPITSQQWLGFSCPSCT